MEEITKAVALPQRHQKMCDICMLIDSDNSKMKFYIYEEDIIPENDKYICENCLNEIKDIRKKCGLKADNPKHNPFKGWMPWYVKDMPASCEKFKEEFA